MAKITKPPSLFAEKVYALTKRIPMGKVSTYKEIARALGTKAYRAVGQTLRCNPYAPRVPCHRVVASNGTLNGFNGSQEQKELNRKKRLLRSEGVSIHGDTIDNFSEFLHRF